MSSSPTTRCCSAIALIAVLTGCAARTSPSPADVSVPARSSETLGLFPIRPLWNLSLNNGLVAPPAFAGERAYFPIDGDRIAAYDLAAGTLRWIVTARAQSQPAVGDDLLFVVEPDSLVAFREDTGAEAWRLPFTEALATPLVWDNEWLIATTVTGSVLAFRARDGDLIWRKDAGANVRALPALAADHVYIATEDGLVTAFGVTDGRRLWSHRIGGAGNAMLALDNRVYLGSSDNFFYCLDAESGLILWRWRTGADVIGLPVADAHHVYFVSLDNMLRALDRNVGNQRWLKALPMRPSRGPIIVGDAVLVTGNSATVRAFAAKDGVAAGDLPAGSGLAALPHVAVRGGVPSVMLVVADLTEGTIVKAFTRSLDPAEVALVPLPDIISPPRPAGLPTAPPPAVQK